MKKEFTVRKTDNLWKVNYFTISKYKYEEVEWYFQTLEDLCVFMEDHLDSLEEIESKEAFLGLFTYNKIDNSIN